MSDQRNIWDDKLKDSLAGLEGDIRMDSWDAIAFSLDKRDRRRRFFFYFSVAALLVLVAGLGWHFFGNNAGNDQVTPTEIVQDNDNGQNIDQNIEPNENSAAENTSPEQTTEVDEPSDTPKPITNTNQQASESPSPRANAEKDNSGLDKGVSNNPPAGNDAKDPEGDKAEKEPSIAKQEQERNNKATPELPVQPDNGGMVPNVPENKDSVNSEKDVETETQPVVAQKTDSAKKQGPEINPVIPGPKGNFELGITFNTGAVNQLLGINNSEKWRLNDRFMNIQDSSQSRSNGYHLRLNALWYLSDKTYFATGLSYTQRQENVNYDYTITEGYHLDLNKRELHAFPLDPIAYQTVKFNNTNTYNFAEIPVRIGKIVDLSQHIELRGEIGANYMFMLGATGQSIDESFLTLTDLSKHQFMKQHVLGAGAKFGIYYTPKNNLRFGLEQGYETTINSIYNKQSAVRVNPYNFGANFTVNYLLMKR